MRCVAGAVSVSHARAASRDQRTHKGNVHSVTPEAAASTRLVIVSSRK